MLGFDRKYCRGFIFMEKINSGPFRSTHPAFHYRALPLITIKCNCQRVFLANIAQRLARQATGSKHQMLDDGALAMVVAFGRN